MCWCREWPGRTLVGEAITLAYFDQVSPGVAPAVHGTRFKVVEHPDATSDATYG